MAETTTQPNGAGDPTPAVTTPVISSEVRTLLAQHGQVVETPDQLEAAVRYLSDEIGRLKPLADDGRAYHADLVEAALAEGVRAMGDAFPAETYREMLKGAPLDHIKRVRDAFAAQAKEVLPAERKTKDGDEGAPPAGKPAGDDSRAPETPAAAYGGH